MIVDECDNYELQDITDTSSFNFSTTDSWASSRIIVSRGGGGRGGHLRRSGLSHTNSVSFFLITFSIYIENSSLGGGPLIPAGCTLYSIHCIHYKITIPHCTNYVGYIRNLQPVNNVQSMVRKKRKETVFR